MEKTNFTKFTLLLLLSLCSILGSAQVCTSSETIPIPNTVLNDDGNTAINLSSTIPAGATIEQVTLDLAINHTWVGDLSATLTSPDGTIVNLFDRPGFPASGLGCDGSNVDINFSDGATDDATVLENTCNPAAPSISGAFQPIDPFSGVGAESADGGWVLTIGDGAAGDSGTLLASSDLVVCFFPPGVCPELQDPVLVGTCPADVVIECSDPLPVPPVIMASDDCGFPGGGDLAFINEFHYDNTGGDTGEFVEIAGTAGTDLTGYTLILYNGANGNSYNTINLSGVIPNETGGAGALAFMLPANGLQNGPDGFALVDAGGTVLEFLSYEGSPFTANNGAAVGMISTVIGVSEPSSTPIGESLQLTGAGATTWVGPLVASPGLLNAGETITLPVDPGPITLVPVDVFTPGACANEGTITRTWTATDASGKTVSCSQIITLEDNTEPTFTSTLPMDETVACGLIPVAATVTAEDNCGGNVIPWVNEFHYDNAGGDVGEFIEVAGSAGTNLAGYTIETYNGNGGTLFSTIALSGIIPDEGMSYGAISFAATGLMNGAPDGFALIDPNGGVIEFWSYEGTFTATAGAANGMTSTDVGVSETGGTPIGESLQLTGSGGMGVDFSWSGPTAESPGLLNTGQTITGNIPVVFAEVSVGDCATGSTVTRTWTATDPCGNAMVHVQTITVVPDLPPVYDCPQNIILHLDPGACDAIVTWNDPVVTDDCSVVTSTQTGGPLSGSEFDIGTTTTITYESSVDDCGNTSTCSFDITIIEYVPTSNSITCNDLVNVTLDATTCLATLGADQVLEGNDYGCYDEFTVMLLASPDPNAAVIDAGPLPVLSSEFIGQTLGYKVINPAGVECWGAVFVEDKNIPDLVCENVTIPCSESTDPGSSFSVTGNQAFPTLASATGITTTTVDVTTAGNITDLDVAILTDHTWVGDLVITVTSPAGTSVELLNNLGGPGFGCNNAAGDDMDVLMDDEAVDTYATMAGLCPPTGTFQPLQLLSAFDGEAAAGTWTLTVEDLAAGDDGDVNVTLNISAGATVAFPLPDGVAVTPSGPNTWTLIGFDPCGPATLTSSDSQAGDLCAGTSAITRTWNVVDGSGNETSCVQTINITPTTLADILGDLPADLTLECGATLPPVPTEIGCENIGIGLQGDPIIIDICTNSYKVIRNFILVDWCTNETATHQQIIKVIDTQGPVLTCPDNMQIGSSSNSCSGSVIVPYPTWDDCSGGVTFIVAASTGDVNGNVITNLPLGTTVVTYTGTDACGNDAECSITITVADDIAPTPVCIETTSVSITSDGTAFIEAASFDNGSHDNCGIVSMDVRRMDNPSCPGFDGTPFESAVPFSCCDVNSTVMVEFRVTDEAGNVNSCMVEVLVEDKINPTIVSQGNKLINCDADYLDDITLGQPLPAAAVAAHGAAFGGDNCNFTISNNVIGNDVDCGAGTITIAWTVTDDQGLTASVIQQYTVENNDPFMESDITWPLDYTATTCGVGLEPTDLSAPFNKPQLAEGTCDNIAYGHWDVELTFGADDACLKILRKWYVVDWCQAQNNQDPTQPGPGVWHYTQVLKVINSNPPNINCVNDGFPEVYQNFHPSCQGVLVPLEVTATDDCTAENLLDFSWVLSNGNSGTGPDASQVLENGSYSITFTVNDQCGNESICTESFTVVDAKKPTPVCLAGAATAVMPSSGSVTIPVSVFESGQSSDNCTIYEDLQFSFSQDVNDTELLIECADIPASGFMTITIYVTDEAGNFDFCTANLFVDDTNGVCPNPNALIEGVIENENQEAIQDVKVTLTDDNGMNLPVMTNSEGEYTFGMNFGDYQVTPEKDFNYLNGVTTYDLVLISKHILGTEVLNSPYKWIAADANNSKTITALDIVKLRALILHIDDELAANDSWRFVNKNYVFQTVNNPIADDFPEVIDLTGNTTYDPINFTAVKIGDVNGTAIPNQLLGTDTRTFNGKLTLQLAAEKVSEGETFTVDFRAKDFNNIAGYQFTLGFEKATFEDVTTHLEGLTTANFGLIKLSENVITTSWNNAKGVNVDNGAILFSMTFTANENLNTADIIAINSRYTESEAYDGSDLFEVVLEFNGTEISNDFELFQNTPNPFKAETMIGFNVPQSGAVTLKIMDLSGRTLRLIEMDATKGYNSINVDRANLNASGVVYYQLETATATAIKKMIIVD